jgi:hypothetical protein
LASVEVLMRALTFALVLAAQAQAWAKPSQPAPPPPQRLDDFGDEVIEGGKPTPDDTIVTTRGRKLSPSLIRLRQDFHREMLKSADGV